MGLRRWLTPEQIMAESFRIITAEVGSHPFDAVEWQIVRRIIHASGDLEFARLVHFQHAAAHRRTGASGMPIVTDVRMVASGIQRPVLENWALPCIASSMPLRSPAWPRSRGLHAAPAPCTRP